MRRIRWAPAAADDLQAIRDYLREHHSALAQSTIRKLYDLARSLRQFPHRGRGGAPQYPGDDLLLAAQLRRSEDQKVLMGLDKGYALRAAGRRLSGTRPRRPEEKLTPPLNSPYQ